jgi:hypothetical protein
MVKRALPTPKQADTGAEQMGAEYDFASLGKPVRGRHHDRMKEGSNIVLLEPDVSEAFPTAEAVNGALRSILEIAKSVRSSQPRRRSAKPRSSR